MRSPENGVRVGRPPKGDRALTEAERQARLRKRRNAAIARMRSALLRIAEAKSIGEARRLAADALQTDNMRTDA